MDDGPFVAVDGHICELPEWEAWNTNTPDMSLRLLCWTCGVSLGASLHERVKGWIVQLVEPQPPTTEGNRE